MNNGSRGERPILQGGVPLLQQSLFASTLSSKVYSRSLSDVYSLSLSYMCPHIHNQISLSDVIFAIHPCIFTLPPAKNTKTHFLDVKEEMIFLFCHLRCSLVPTISDMKSLISSLAICSNTSVVGPDQVQAALIVSPPCIISTIALNKKFKPFEEPTPVTVPLFISSKRLSRRTKMFKEKFVNSETLHVTIHDFQRKSFNKILRCSKISKPLAKSFEVNNYLKRLISKK